MRTFSTAAVIGLMSLSLAASATSPVKSWAYQLQGYDSRALRSIGVDLLVVDADELRTSGVSTAELKRSNKRVVSYLSVGEAESYRSYWQRGWTDAPPAWLGEENPDWPGNFKVQYWNPRWQRLMKAAVRKIAQDGFDGVYLDLVDAYEPFQEQGMDWARQAMIDFVLDLAAEGRKVRPGFVVIAQNAAELTSDSDYLAAIDGLAKEDTWYYGDQPKHPAEVEYDLHQLQRVRRAGKFVVAIDYTTNFGPRRDFCRRARDRGIIPFVAPRDLDRLPRAANEACPPVGRAVVSATP